MTVFWGPTTYALQCLTTLDGKGTFRWRRLNIRAELDLLPRDGSEKEHGIICA